MPHPAIPDPADPDAVQAFEDALPIVAELLDASARVPGLARAGQQMRRAEQAAAVQRHVADLTERVHLKALRAGVRFEDFMAAAEAAVRRKARGERVALGRPKLAAIAGGAPQDDRWRALRHREAELTEQHAAAMRETARARTALEIAMAAQCNARAALDAVLREIRGLDQGSAEA